MSAQPEVWRVSTPEGIFETDLETLKQWIGEGCVLPFTFYFDLVIACILGLALFKCAHRLGISVD